MQTKKTVQEQVSPPINDEGAKNNAEKEVKKKMAS